MTDKPTLKGSVALVTGAQQGIGRAAAIGLAEAGCHVAINFLDDEGGARETQAEVEAAGARSVLAQGDISDSRQVKSMLDAAGKLGPVTVVVNNAGIFPRVAFLDMTEQQWDEVIGVNLRGTFLVLQEAARRMVAAGAEGSIVNLASSAAFRGSPRGVHYVSSKAGIVGLTRASALELAVHKIRVNAIAPGLTDTAQPRFGMSEGEIEATAATIPLGTITRPDEVADLVVFLASPAGRKITGQTIHINGGQYLY